VKLSLERFKVERGLWSFITKYSPDLAFIVISNGIKDKVRIDSCEVRSLGPASLIKELGGKDDVPLSH